MTNEIIVKPNTGEIIQESNSINFSTEQIELIKRTICKEATEDELKLFLHIAQKSGLDPFSRQIFAVKYKDTVVAQTSIDGYRLIAERTGRYAPGKAPDYEYDSEGKLKKATVYVKKLIGNEWHETAASAIYEEYLNERNWLWKKMPHVMLAKCAESLALRRAFPNETQGLYTIEEFGSDHEKSVIQQPKAKSASMDMHKERQETERDTTSNRIESDEPRPEPRNHPNVDRVKQTFQPATQAQIGKISVELNKAGISDDQLETYLVGRYKKKHRTELTKEEASEFIDHLVQDLISWV